MQILDDIAKVRILVVGDVMLDRYWWGSVDRISPEAPVPVVRLERMSIAAGGAANVAVNLAGLGATPYLLGIVGDDTEADLAEGVISDAGVHDRHLTRVPTRRTTVKTRIVAHHQHVVRIDQEDREPIDNETESRLLDGFRDLLPSVDAVILSDYAKGVLTRTVVSEIMTAARRLEKLVVVDPKDRDLTRYQGASVITPNQREAAAAVAMDPLEPDVASRAGTQLMNELDVRALLITQGEDGMTLFERDREPKHRGSLAQDVFDVTGAGDTVIAAFTAAAAAGHTFLDAATLANVAAGMVVGRVGTTSIDRAMLAEFVDAYGHQALFENAHA